MTVDLSKSRLVPHAHQILGVQFLLDQPKALLADEMRLGKTKQVIDTVQILFERGEINVAIVVAPASVRSVWFDHDLGEIAKHRWLGLPTLVTEFHQSIHKWSEDASDSKRYLTWIITNYEYIRHGLRRTTSGWHGDNLAKLLPYARKDAILVADESAALQTYDSMQTRACMMLRSKCSRVIELNGTPVTETPESLFSQARLLDASILGIKTVGQLRARYAIMGGYRPVKRIWDVSAQRMVEKQLDPTEILGWRHLPRPDCCTLPPYITSGVHAAGPGLEEIREKMKPYVLRRVRSECLDLPPKLDPVVMTATLTAATWRMYKDMREDTVAWLDSHRVASSAQAAAKVMRLHQLTSGFLGGVSDEEATCPECAGTGQLSDQATLGGLLSVSICPSCHGGGEVSAPLPVQPIGREKLDLYMDWVNQRLKIEPNLRMLTWVKFRAEHERTINELRTIFPKVQVAGICGGQTAEERLKGLRLMHPDVKYDGPAILVGTIGTGALGLNMAGAHEVVRPSHDRSLYKYLQSEDRPIGPGQTHAVSYHDIVAVGPQGQKTVDHDIIANLRSKRELATWTVDAWKQVLQKENQ